MYARCTPIFEMHAYEVGAHMRRYAWV
jgi:hypothetical protein